MWRSPVLAGLGWCEHGFGTRLADPWAEAEAPIANLRQVHSNTILKMESGCDRPSAPEGDGMVSGVAGLWLSIRTADCVPVLIADGKRRVVGAAHAGWRGTVAGIVPGLVERMTREFGTDPSDIAAAVGPAIGVCCFEVGPEVATQFEGRWEGVTQGRYVDLAATIVCQLRQSGVAAAKIDAGGPCTRCSTEFHSFRRDREGAGRMHSAIRIR
ncbi:MAG: peptidoglycan editing factor PgeF [Bryobacteraceae bacterium]